MIAEPKRMGGHRDLHPATSHEWGLPVSCAACGVTLPGQDRRAGHERCWWCREWSKTARLVQRGFAAARRKYSGLTGAVPRHYIDASMTDVDMLAEDFDATVSSREDER